MRSEMVDGHRVLASAQQWVGAQAASCENYASAAALYRSAPERFRTHPYGEDSLTFCLGQWAWSLWFLGRTDQSLALLGEGRHRRCGP